MVRKKATGETEMRPIDADDAKKDFGAHFGDVQDAICAQQIIDRQPTIDRESLIPHGRWESVKNPRWPAYSHDKCSVCGWWNTRNALCYDGGHKPGHSLNYCPNCGAKMIEEVLNA